MDWYVMVWQKFAQFNGRSRRKEYWMFALFNAIICIVLYGAGLVLLMQGSNLGYAILAVYGVYALAVLIPGLAVSVRRLHDTNKSGWWLLLALIPLVNLALIVLMCIDGDPGDNQFGPNPKLFPQPAVHG